MNPITTIIAAAIALNLTGCLPGKADVYTLYRNSPVDKNMRVHWATFDASNSSSYNQENCEIGRQLLQSQNGVTVKFWCEKGKYQN